MTGANIPIRRIAAVIRTPTFPGVDFHKRLRLFLVCWRILGEVIFESVFYPRIQKDVCNVCGNVCDNYKDS
jgi:hypothetical protein